MRGTKDLYYNENDIAPRWVHRESNLKFTQSSDKDQRKKIAFAFAFTHCKRNLTLNGLNCTPA